MSRIRQTSSAVKSGADNHGHREDLRTKRDLLTPSPPLVRPLSYRPAEAARALGVSERTLWTWTKNSVIPHVRIGSVVLYPVAELERWLLHNTLDWATTPATTSQDSTENDVEK